MIRPLPLLAIAAAALPVPSARDEAAVNRSVDEVAAAQRSFDADALAA